MSLYFLTIAKVINNINRNITSHSLNQTEVQIFPILFKTAYYQNSLHFLFYPKLQLDLNYRYSSLCNLQPLTNMRAFSQALQN